MLDHKKLKKVEIYELKKLINKYAFKDKLDILMEIALNRLGVSINEFNDRSIVIKREIIKVKITAPIGVMFCDSDHCEVVYEKC